MKKKSGVKKGSIFQLKKFNSFQTSSGIVDSKEQKTTYLKLVFHLHGEENVIRNTKNLIWGIRQTISSFIKEDIFHNKFITEIDIPETFKDTRKACIKLEFTFFPNDIYDRKQYTETFNLLCDKIQKRNFNVSKNYKIFRTQWDIPKMM